MPKRYASRELIKLAEEFGWSKVSVKRGITITSNIRRADLLSLLFTLKKTCPWGERSIR
jgi:hypothetical protein